MKDVAKILLKILLWILIIFLLLSLIGTSVSALAKKFNWNLGSLFGINSVPVDNLQNDMGSQLFGGYTIEQVEKLREDVNAPICDDIFEDFILQDLGNYVVAYRPTKNVSNENVCYNALFVKTDKGLIWDGAIGISAKCHPNWFTGNFDETKIEFTLSNDIVSYIKKGKTKENIVTFSDFNQTFATDFGNTNPIALAIVFNKNTNKLQNATRKYLLNNVVIPYFFNLGGSQLYSDLEDLTDEEKDFKAIALLNSYVTHLYQQSNELKENETKLVSLNDYFVKPIPTNLIENYPVPANKKADYGNKDFYLAYNCNIIANCRYFVEETNIKRDDDKIVKNTDEIPVTKVPEVVTNYSKLLVKLNNQNNSDLINLNIADTPVTISFGAKSVVFDSLEDLQSGLSVALESNKLTYYTIYSNALVFNSYSGSFTTSNNQVLTLDYSYQYSYVNTSIKIIPVSNTQSGVYDLSQYPVKIVLTGKNNEGTFQFVFDNNSKVNTQISMLVKKGNYTYSVLSSQLIFGSTNGDIIVSENSRSFTFSFAVETHPNDLWFNVSIAESVVSSTTDFTLKGDVDSVEILSSKLNDSAFKIEIKVFDKDGYIVKTFNHSHISGSASCNDSFNSNGVLNVGSEYTIQMLYLSSKNPDTSYVSDIVNFTYKTNTCFTITYQCGIYGV